MSTETLFVLKIVGGVLLAGLVVRVVTNVAYMINER